MSARLRDIIPIDIYPLGELLGLHIRSCYERPQSPRETSVRGIRDHDALDATLVPFPHRTRLAAASGAVQEQLSVHVAVQPSLGDFDFHHVTLQARGLRLKARLLFE